MWSWSCKEGCSFHFPMVNDEVSERSKRAKSRECQRFNFLHVHPRVWKTNINYTMHLTSLKRRLKAKIQIKKHSKKRETFMPRIKILNKSCFFQNLVWRGLDRMMMTYFSTKDFGVTEPWWHFGTLLNLAPSLRCRGTQAAKKWEKASQTILIHFRFFPRKEKQRNRKREIEPIDQLWMFLKRVRLGLFESNACLGFVVSKAITGENSTSRLLPFPHSLSFNVQQEWYF